MIRFSDDGTMAYDAGKYSVSFADAKGHTVTDEGKFLNVFRPVNGEWKIVIDAFSSNQPPPKMTDPSGPPCVAPVTGGRRWHTPVTITNALTGLTDPNSTSGSPKIWRLRYPWLDQGGVGLHPPTCQR